LALLEPYGLENPEPIVVIKGLSIKGLPRVVGRSNNHLQATVTDGQNEIRTIAFNMGKMERSLSERDVRIDVICQPYINVWNDFRNVELKIQEIRMHHENQPEFSVGSAEIDDTIPIKIIDRRNIPNKIQYVKKLANIGEKSIIYVRDDMAIDQLHKIIAPSASNNNLGLCYSTTPEDESDEMKAKFVSDELKTIISSVPFEEPLMGLRHLVFCHPVPTRDMFIYSCSPAIESSDAVHIHLIFNNNDIDLLTMTLNQQYRDRQLLSNVYRKIRELYKDAPVPLDEILSNMKIDEPKDLIVSRCLEIFEELNLVSREQNNGLIAVSILPEPEKRRDLSESAIYSNGDKIKSEWTEFSRFINSNTAEDILKMILDHF